MFLRNSASEIFVLLGLKMRTNTNTSTKRSSIDITEYQNLLCFCSKVNLLLRKAHLFLRIIYYCTL